MNNISQITLSAILALTTSGTFAADKVRVGYLAEPAHGLHFIAREKAFSPKKELMPICFSSIPLRKGAQRSGRKNLMSGPSARRRRCFSSPEESTSPSSAA